MKNCKKSECNIGELYIDNSNIVIKKEIFMRKITKTLIAILLMVIMSMTNVVVFATEGTINPRLSHTSNGGFTFIAENNVGYIDATYYGYDSFVRADLNVKVQKRFLLVFWNDVYEWNASSTEKNGDFYHEFDIEKSGTYRANFTLTVTGNDGTSDVITSTIEDDN